MAARLLAAALALELALYLAMSELLLPPPLRWTGLLLIPIAMVTLRVCLVLVSFMISAPMETAERLSLQERVRMWAKECAAFFKFQWLILRGPSPDHFPPIALPRRPDRPLVVLLHGIFCSGAIWRPIAATLAQRTGCEVWTPSIQGVTASLPTQIEEFIALLERENESRRQPLILIGHSLGGLIAREAARKAPHLRIEQVICMGSPHAGTVLAQWLPVRIARDLRPHAPAPHAVPGALLNIYCEHDNLVVPAQSSRLCGACNVCIRGCGHMALIYSSRALELLAQQIARHSTREGVERASR